MDGGRQPMSAVHSPVDAQTSTDEWVNVGPTFAPNVERRRNAASASYVRVIPPLSVRNNSSSILATRSIF